MYPYGGYYYGFDPTMIILIPAILFTIYAQFKVTSTTSRYLKVRSQKLNGKPVFLDVAHELEGIILLLLFGRLMLNAREVLCVRM